MTPSVTAGLGFLIGILWMDLIFDTQLVRRRPDDANSTISAYYRHATRGARPMDMLIAAVMIVTLIAIVVQLLGDDTPDWVSWASLVLAGAPIALAAVSTVPSAVKVGESADERLARVVLRDHMIAVCGVTAALIVQLVWA